MSTASTNHLRQNNYDGFRLTDAVRPGPAVPIMPVEGFRISRYRDAETGECFPVIGASVSAEKLFDLFLDLLEPLGERVNVVLETSHDTTGDFHDDMRRGEIDLPVLQSHFCDFEDLLTNDGCTGVAVMSAARKIEVQMDEHKLLFVFARNLKPFRRILRKHGIPKIDDLRVLAEAEHYHHSQLRHLDEFQQLATRLGAADYDTVLTDESDLLGF
ncbi:hypothetical protein [Zavarzinella formosa]|uniref:hypothetical protein n=1 Tax=Zavarzinella formosa TaxID=360055 RepID=UPI0003695E87|nr:hypothetical protein [Zavarzinella formosa]